MTFTEDFLFHEIKRTHPDYVVYVPNCDDTHDDHGNEHFHVFRTKDGNLAALWTMSAQEATHTQRPVFSRSFNGGLTWTEPKCILHDPIDPETGKNMGSWAAAAVSKSGRIYVYYAKHLGDGTDHECGVMVFTYSDDCGETWSKEVVRKEKRYPGYDLDGEDAAISLFPWQNGYRLSNGSVLMLVSHNWKHPNANPEPKKWWPEHACGCEILRFDNIDDDPEPENLVISRFAANEKSLNAPFRTDPSRRCGEEPALAELPDGRLFCVFRTCEGHVWYSVSEDHGETWRECEMLRYRDNGEGVEHPLSPCPMFRISDNQYVLFTHNNDGFFGQTDRPKTDGNWRNPLFVLKGEFRPDAHQPIWFSQPVEFMNNGDVALTRKDLAMYASLTVENGTPVFWYPDRKFFLLGKRLEKAFLDTLSVPMM